MSSKDIIKKKEDEIKKNKIEIDSLKSKIQENEIIIEDQSKKMIEKDTEIEVLTDKCNKYDIFVKETSRSLENTNVLLSQAASNISELNKENKSLISNIKYYESKMDKYRIITIIITLAAKLKEIQNEFIILQSVEGIPTDSLNTINSIIPSITILYDNLTKELDNVDMKELSKYTVSVPKNIKKYTETLSLIRSEIENAKKNQSTSSDITQQEKLDTPIENFDEIPSKEEDTKEEDIPGGISIEEYEDSFTKKRMGGRILRSRKFRILSKKSKRLTRRK